MTTPEFKKISQIVQIASLYPASALPSDMHQAYPIPIPQKQDMLIAFMYSSLVYPEPGYPELCPPSYIAYIDATSGKFIQLIAAKPNDFGMHDEFDKPLGPYNPPLREDETYLNAEILLYQAYDALLPEYLTGNIAVEETFKNEAQEFLTRFQQIGEHPLMHYYENMGQHFFNWLNAIKTSS
jgi:hypothetical protein